MGTVCGDLDTTKIGLRWLHFLVACGLVVVVVLVLFPAQIAKLITYRARSVPIIPQTQNVKLPTCLGNHQHLVQLTVLAC